MSDLFKNQLSDDIRLPMIELLQDVFSSEFLNSEGENPLQLLWKRKDAIAAVELYYFSECLRRLFQIDKKWTIENLLRLKEADKHNFRGIVFEIIALGMLSHEENKVYPSKKNQPGIDGIVYFATDSKINFSIKNFNHSTYQEEFNKNGQQVERLLIQLAKNFGCSSLEVLIEGKKTKILATDWDDLRKNISSCIKQFNGNNSLEVEIEAWRIAIKPLIAIDGLEFSKFEFSYTLVMYAPFHPNEKDNLISRIVDARDNMLKHAPEETEGKLNFIFIQLPPTASFNKSIEWASEFLNDEKSISGIMFYQPFFYSDGDEENFYLINPLKFVTDERYRSLGFGNRPFPVYFPVGQVISNPPAKLYGSKDLRLSPENEMYIYQSGNHYYKAVIKELKEESLTIELKLKMHDFGIVVHNILEVSTQVGVKLETTYYPPGDRLYLI